MKVAALPAQYEEQLQRLSAPAWRVRKEAAASLREWITDDLSRTEIMEPLAERLLDGVLDADGLDGRAACHEVLVAIGPLGIASIVRRLNSPAPSQRLLVDLLGEVGASEEIPRLTGIVLDESADQNLRAAAATALGRLGGPEAVRSLCRVLHTKSQMLVVHALDALVASQAAVPITEVEALAASPFTRKSSVAVLGHSADPAALPALLQALDDTMAGVRAAAARGLVRLQEDLARRGKAGIVAAALERIGDQTRGHIRQLIEGSDAATRSAAIHLAGLARDAAALDVVVGLMDDPLILERVLTMVANLGPTAAPALLRISERAGSAAREHLLRMVGALDPQSVTAEVGAFVAGGLSDSNDDSAIAAAEALARVGGRSSLGELYRALATEDRLGEAAADAMAAVLRRSDASAAADLQLIVGQTWPESGALARNLCRVVGQLGRVHHAPHLVSLLGSADVGVRVAAAQAMGKLVGEHEGVAALSFALTDEEPQVRAAACRSLGELRAPQSVTSLLTATSDREASVRAAAVTALVDLDNPVGLARLRAIIVEDPVATVVVRAIAGLGSSSLEHDLTMLMSLCTSKDWEVVKAAARALSGFTAHRATAALLGLLGHPRWDVRWAAAEVLSERDDKTALEPLRGALAAEEDSLVRHALGEAIAHLEPGG